MKSALCIFLGLYLIPLVQAEPLNERDKLAVELVELIAANRPNAIPSNEDFKQSIAVSVERTILEFKLNPKKSELLREAALEAMAEIDIDQITKMVENAYANNLSVKVLNETITFFKTDAGKAWLQKSDLAQADYEAQCKALSKEIMMDTRRRLAEQGSYFEQKK